MAYIKKLVKSQALRTFQTILNAAQNTFCSASRTIDGCRPPGKYCRYHTKGTGSRAIVVFGTSNMIRSSTTALHVQDFEYQQDSKTIFWWVLISLSKEIMSQDCKGQCFLKQQGKDISCLDSWSFGYLTSQHKQIQVIPCEPLGSALCNVLSTLVYLCRHLRICPCIGQTYFKLSQDQFPPYHNGNHFF